MNSSIDFYARMIARRGELLTVTAPAKIGIAKQVARIYMQPQPISIKGAQQFGMEGALNYLADKPHAFICALGTMVGTAPISAGHDVAYNGETYKILTVTPYRLGGVSLALNCVAKLYKAGS